MAKEFIYTSAPKGIRAGSSGYCGVVSTQGVTLEDEELFAKLSEFNLSNESSEQTANLSHVRARRAQSSASVVFRTCAAGLDYSNRQRKLSHFYLLAESDLDASGAGPAWLASQQQLFVDDWRGEPTVKESDVQMPNGTLAPAVCQHWGRVAGDPGWGGVLAEQAADLRAKPILIIYPPGVDVLPLLIESTALLSTNDRWFATFATNYVSVPSDVDCRWRCVPSHSPLIDRLRADHAGSIIDLTQDIGAPHDSSAVEAARIGSFIVASTPGYFAPADPFTNQSVDSVDQSHEVIQADEHPSAGHAPGINKPAINEPTTHEPTRVESAASMFGDAAESVNDVFDSVAGNSVNAVPATPTVPAQPIPESQSAPPPPPSSGAVQIQKSGLIVMLGAAALIGLMVVGSAAAVVYFMGRDDATDLSDRDSDETESGEDDADDEEREETSSDNDRRNNNNDRRNDNRRDDNRRDDNRNNDNGGSRNNRNDDERANGQPNGHGPDNRNEDRSPRRRRSHYFRIARWVIGLVPSSDDPRIVQNDSNRDPDDDRMDPDSNELWLADIGKHLNEALDRGEHLIRFGPRTNAHPSFHETLNVDRSRVYRVLALHPNRDTHEIASAEAGKELWANVRLDFRLTPFLRSEWRLSVDSIGNESNQWQITMNDRGDSFQVGRIYFDDGHMRFDWIDQSPEIKRRFIHAAQGFVLRVDARRRSDGAPIEDFQCDIQFFLPLTYGTDELPASEAFERSSREIVLPLNGELAQLDFLSAVLASQPSNENRYQIQTESLIPCRPSEGDVDRDDPWPAVLFDWFRIQNDQNGRPELIARMRFQYFERLDSEDARPKSAAFDDFRQVVESRSRNADQLPPREQAFWRAIREGLRSGDGLIFRPEFMYVPRFDVRDNRPVDVLIITPES